MTYKLRKFVIALLLICAVVVNLQALVYVSASDADPTDASVKLPETGLTQELSALISAEDMESGGHLYRVKEEERSLDSVVMKNVDGSMTTYIFSENVKYIDSSGVVRDKKNTLTDSIADIKYQGKYAYGNSDNDVSLYFPKSLDTSTGVILGKDEYGIELIPLVASSGKITASSTVSLSPEKKQITDSFDASIKEVVDYKSVFGSNSTLRYAPTINGFKEDIILDTYDGTNEFVFLLKTNGLRLVYNDGYSLIDPQTSQTIISMGDLVVYHKGGTELSTGYAHEYVTETVKEDAEYLIKIVIDEDFLLDDSTVYPVVIDPSFTILFTNNNIMDIAVRANGIVYNDSINNGVGHHNTLLEDMRTFMKFPGLIDNEAIGEFAPPGFGGGDPEIQSIKLQMYSRATSFVNTLVYVYPYNTSNALNWTYNTTRFTTAQFNAKGSLWSSTSVPSSPAQWVEFNITNVIDSGNTNGIVLINQYEGEDNEAVYQSFASTKDPTHKPRIAVNWTGEDNADFDSAVSMYTDIAYDVNVTASGQKKYFAFTPTATGNYVFESYDIVSSDPKGWLYDSNETQLAVNDDYGDNTNFRITRALQANQTYYLAAGCYGTITGSYKLSVTLDAPPLPLSPTGLTYSNLTENSVRLSWTIPSNHNADNWIIQRRVNGGTWGDWASVSATESVHNETGLTPSRVYEYRVCGEAGATAGSGVKSETSSNVISVKMLPSQPTGLAVSNKTDTTVSLTWNTPSYHGTDRWRVEYNVDSQGWQAAGISHYREYTMTGLRAGTVYAFRVYAESGTGDQTITDSIVSATVRAKTLPAQPTGLEVSDKTDTTVTLSWNVPYYHGADRWLIQYRTTNGTWTNSGICWGDEYTVTGLSASTTYEFRVYGEHGSPQWGGTWSLPSNIASATTYPTNPTIQQMLNNIQNSDNIFENKLTSCYVMAETLFEMGYEPAFIAGMLSNICYEGEPGLFEYYNTSEGVDYHVNFNKFLQVRFSTTYEEMFNTTWNVQSDSGYIYNKDLNVIYDIFSELYDFVFVELQQEYWWITDEKQKEWGIYEGRGNLIGTGIGSVGWSFDRLWTLLDFYRRECNYSSTINETQTINAEIKMIVYELTGEDAYIYDQWLEINSSDLNSKNAAEHAGGFICQEYEKPYDPNGARKNERIIKAGQIYEDMLGI
ncbi:MAG: fibronectin type III domain-containing protein [Clostridia bacterium]|nr:fibronectin type III domain-containing protein [Clostridia bacterium]